MEKQQANTAWRVITRWVQNGTLEQWLDKPDKTSNAINDFRQMQPDSDLSSPITYWCNKWLSDAGQKRLMGNIRQTSYFHKPHNKIKNIQIKEQVHAELKLFADEYGLTISDALKQLLEKARE